MMHSSATRMLALTIGLIVFIVLAMPLSVGNAPFVPDYRINDVLVGVQAAPKVAAFPDGRFGVVWHDSRAQTMLERNYDIFYVTLSPDGTPQNPSIRVNDDVGTEDQTFPALAIDDLGRIHVVWQDFRDGYWNVYYARSNDGMTFLPNARVNMSAGNQLQPEVAVNNLGDPYVVWADQRGGDPDIYYANSTDGGNTFEPAIRVDDDTGNANQLVPSLAIETDGTVHFVWVEWRNDADGRWSDFGGIDGFNNADIYARSFNGSWSTSVRVNNDSGYCIQGAQAVALTQNDTLVVAWTDYRNDADGYPVGWPPVGGTDGADNGDIYVAVRYPGNNDFSAAVRANDDTIGRLQDMPALVAGAGRVHLTWVDAENSTVNYTGADIMYANTTLPLTGFGSSIRVNTDGGSSLQLYPSVAMASNLLVVWHDNRSDPEWDVYAAFLPFMPPSPDTTPPAISQVNVVPSPQHVGGKVNISANLTDDSGQVFVRINITGPDGTNLGNLTMTYDGVDGRYYHNATYGIIGNYSFTIWANDTSGNWNSSSGAFIIEQMLGSQNNSFLEEFWWLLLIVAIIIIVVLVLLFYMKRRKRVVQYGTEDESQGHGETPLHEDSGEESENTTQ